MLIHLKFSSLALISGRATINSLDTLAILVSNYLYILCQGEPHDSLVPFASAPSVHTPHHTLFHIIPAFGFLINSYQYSIP